MKKFTKFMVSAAAMAAVAASMSMAAMAADTVTGTYTSATGLVELSGVVPSGDQQTLLVLDGSVASKTETVTSANASTVIAQIDQAGSISQFYLPSGLTSGTYYIRIGGTNGGIQEGTLEIGGGQVATVTITIGDVSGDKQVKTNDVTMVKRYLANYASGKGNTGVEKQMVDSTKVVIGDVSGDKQVKTNDVTMIKRYLANYASGKGNTGNTVDVVDE